MASDWLGPIAATEEEGLELLLKRYLAGFGPGRLADAASWAGVPAKKLQPAAEKLNLRRFEDEEGKELLDLPRAPLPIRRHPRRRVSPSVGRDPPRARAPRQILADEYRPLIFTTKTPQSVNTFLVDGAVAGKWSVKRTAKKAELLVEPFEKLPTKAKKELQAEVRGSSAFTSPTRRLTRSGSPDQRDAVADSEHDAHDATVRRTCSLNARMAVVPSESSDSSSTRPLQSVLSAAIRPRSERRGRTAS
jgi:hypothetical protein